MRSIRVDLLFNAWLILMCMEMLARFGDIGMLDLRRFFARAAPRRLRAPRAAAVQKKKNGRRTVAPRSQKHRHFVHFEINHA